MSSNDYFPEMQKKIGILNRQIREKKALIKRLLKKESLLDKKIHGIMEKVIELGDKSLLKARKNKNSVQTVLQKKVSILKRKQSEYKKRTRLIKKMRLRQEGIQKKISGLKKFISKNQEKAEKAIKQKAKKAKPKKKTIKSQIKKKIKKKIKKPKKKTAKTKKTKKPAAKKTKKQTIKKTKKPAIKKPKKQAVKKPKKMPAEKPLPKAMPIKQKPIRIKKPEIEKIPEEKTITEEKLMPLAEEPKENPTGAFEAELEEETVKPLEEEKTFKPLEKEKTEWDEPKETTLKVPDFEDKIEEPEETEPINEKDKTQKNWQHYIKDGINFDYPDWQKSVEKNANTLFSIEKDGTRFELFEFEAEVSAGLDENAHEKLAELPSIQIISEEKISDYLFVTYLTQEKRIAKKHYALFAQKNNRLVKLEASGNPVTLDQKSTMIVQVLKTFYFG